MSTLAYYSTIVKKEEVLERISEDILNVANIANDLACDLKAANAAAKIKNIEDLLSSLRKCQQLIVVINTMVDNIHNNTITYTQALVPRQQKEEVESIQQEQESQEEEMSENFVDAKKQGEQLESLVEALKSLKEMQASLDPR